MNEEIRQLLGRALWYLPGTAVIYYLSRSVLMSGPFTIALPMHQLLFGFALGPSYAVIVPAAYVLCLSSLLLSRRPAFLVTVGTGVAITNLAWLIYVWTNLDQVHMDMAYVAWMTALKLVATGVVYALCIYGARRHSEPLQSAGLFLIFVMLAWFALPYFGELP